MKTVAVIACLLAHALMASAQCAQSQDSIDACAGLATSDECTYELEGVEVCGFCRANTRCAEGFCRQRADQTRCPVVTDAPATATDAPATDAPATDIPATDAPATDPPATDPPATDAPATATDAPTTDVPATDIPATDVPATDAPATDIPATDAPATSSPSGTSVAEADITCTTAPVDGNTITEPCMDTYILPRLIAPTFAHQTTLTSTDGRLEVTLTVEQHQLDAGAFKKNVRAYCYEGACSVPGPTLRVFPGDTVVVTLVNNLQDIEAEDTTSDGELNSLRDANITNMHTHGLHVDPSEDNVIIGVAPGESKTYTYEIGTNHLPGTHWYHSHHHGSSSLQVQGGMVGMIVVDVPDFEESPPTDVETFATDAARTQWEEMPVSRMAITHHALCSCNPTGAGFSLHSYSALREATGDNIPLGAELVENSDGTQTQQTLLVNGQRQPVREVRTGVWNRIELLNAVGDVYLEIELRTTVSLNGATGENACTMMLISLDGVFLHSGARTVTHVLLMPGSRAGVAVMCSEAGEYYLQSNPTERASTFDVGFLQNLVTWYVTADGGDDGTTTAPTLAADEIVRPNYLQDLQEVSGVVSEWQISTRQGGVVGGGNHMGVGTDCATTDTDCPQIAFGFPESDDSTRHLENFPYRHVGRLCDIEDVVINGNGGTPHPMHFHVNHFQLISYTGNGVLADWGEVGDWRDTIPSLAGPTRFRHALDGHGGNVMVHCHFLWHEDQGMMDRYYVAALNDDGTAPVEPCTATGTDTYCDDSVPSAAFDDAYPQVPGTCVSYRTSADDVVPVAP